MKAALRLVNAKELSVLLNIPIRTIDSLRRARKIPAVVAGYRTIFFDPNDVLAALKRFEIKEIR